jgi:hypothetical protein
VLSHFLRRVDAARDHCSAPRAKRSTGRTFRRKLRHRPIANLERQRRRHRAIRFAPFTWAIVPLKTSKAAEVKTFFARALTKGQPYGLPLYFLPIPKIVL